MPSSINSAQKLNATTEPGKIYSNENIIRLILNQILNQILIYLVQVIIFFICRYF